MPCPHQICSRCHTCVLEVVGLDPLGNSCSHPEDMLQIPLEWTKRRENFCLGCLQKYSSPKKMRRLGYKGFGCLHTRISSKDGLDSPHCTESMDYYHIPQVCMATTANGLGLIANLAVNMDFYCLEGDPTLFTIY